MLIAKISTFLNGYDITISVIAVIDKSNEYKAKT